MKLIFSILILLALAKECENRDSNSKTSSVVETQLQEESMVFHYEALSRGFFYDVTVDEEKISVQKSRSEEDKAVKMIDRKQWNRLVSLVKKIDVHHMKKMKAPTDKRLYDGAAHAQFTVFIGDTLYATENFDHEYPPKEIEPLVKAILTLAETVEKQ